MVPGHDPQVPLNHSRLIAADTCPSLMTPQEKYLYHQIHPVKLLTDWVTGLLALYFFWRHELVAAAAIALFRNNCLLAPDQLCQS